MSVSSLACELDRFFLKTAALMLCYNMVHHMVRGPDESFQLAVDLDSLSLMEKQVNIELSRMA